MDKNMAVHVYWRYEQCDFWMESDESIGAGYWRQGKKTYEENQKK